MSYQKTASLGMIWLAAGTTVSKIASFLSIIVLGWYLSSEEFALYALAYSCSSIFIAIRNGGIQQILIQRGAQSFTRLSGFFFKYSLWFNFSGMILLLSCMTVFAEVYDDKQLVDIISVIALSLPLSSFSMIFRAKMSIDHKFAQLAKFDSYSSIIRHSSAAGFAYFGFGVFSFVLPIILASLFEIVIGFCFVGGLPVWKVKLNRSIALKIFDNAKWVIFASLATAFVLQGDYLVIGFFESKETIGIYFFGFQLTAAIAVVINSGLQSVIMPIFSKLNIDKNRQINAFSKSFRIYSLCVLIVSSILIITAEPLIHTLWKGKWDQAIIVTQIISYSMMTRLLIPFSRSLLEARKKWKMIFILLVIDAIGILLASLVGVWFGGLIEIAVAVSSYRFIYSFFYLFVVIKKLKIRIQETISPFFSMFLAALIALFYTFYFFEGLFEINLIILKVLYLISSFMIVFLSVVWVIRKKVLLEFIKFLRVLEG
jgi:O-antigen/teichoic acid export membrane protein